jgi:hypothetical protein
VLALATIVCFLVGGITRIANNPFRRFPAEAVEVWASSMIWTFCGSLFLIFLLTGLFIMRRGGALGKTISRLILFGGLTAILVLAVGQFVMTRQAEVIVGHELRFFNRYF